MKLSQYALQLPHEDRGKTWLFHSLTRAVVEIGQDMLEDGLSAGALSKLNREQFLDTHKELAPLLDGYLIVDDDIDEYKAFLYWFKKEKFKNETAIITFLTTAQCNFRCTYCYEGGFVRPRSHMPAEVVQRVYESVKRICSDSGCRAVDFTFFGGEPLLNIPLIENTMEFLTRLTEGRGTRLDTNIVTNGALLNEKNLERLKRANISSLQITIDGMAEDHDKRRPFQSGKGSFELVYENMLAAIAAGFSVVLNMNFDRTNHAGLIRLLETFPRSVREKVEISFSPIKSTKLNAKARACVVTDDDAAGLLRELTVKAIGEGWRLSNFEISEYGPCHFLRANSYIFDPEGNIQKCIYGIGDETYGAGSVFEPPEHIEQNLAQFNGIVPDYTDECRKCAYLPLCMGGCRKEAIDAGAGVSGLVCKRDMIRSSFIDSLSRYLNSTKA